METVKISEKFYAVKDIADNAIRILRLAYEIDKNLVIKYYATALIGAIMPITAALFLKYFIDALISYGQIPQPDNFVMLAVYLLAGYYLAHLIETTCYQGLNVGYYDYLLRNKVQSGLMYRFTKKIGSLDLEHLESSETQNLIAKVRETYQWQIPEFLRVMNYVVSNIAGGAAACIALMTFGWWIPALVFLVSLPRLYLKIKNGGFVWSMYGSGAPGVKKLWYFSWVLSGPNSILETRVFQSQNTILRKMRETQEDLYILNKKPLDNYKKVMIIAPIVESIAVFGVLYLYLPQTLSGALTVGSLTFLISSLDALRSIVAWFSVNIGQLYQQNLFIEPYFELMNLPKLIKEKQHPTIISKITSPRIEFKNVSFTYPGGKEVLKNVSFVIEPKENVALVGNNGAGKTTIIKLLCRFYDVTSGEILINGVNIKDMQLSNWYAHLGTLFQDFMKYQFTIRENIMMGKPGLEDKERMITAAKKAGASEFIEEFPNKYEQMLGKQFEDGEELSGGQWQKLAIARGFYQQAPVLIMDEPTSAIDSEAEFEIFNNLEKEYKDKTLILVSHRFSTVRNAQKIIVIHEGKLIEQGTHHQLLAKGSKYKKMFTTQALGYQ